MIHVCFGLYDKTGRYSKFTGTTIASLFDNTNSEVTVHILHDNTLTQDNRDKFIYLAGRYNQHVKFYNVEKICPDKIAEYVAYFPNIKRDRVSIGTLYRFLISHLLPNEIEKVIYLDSDIVVNLDINELWRIELNYKPLAAVPEILNRNDVQTCFALANDNLVKVSEYFNAGVLIMNLKVFREQEQSIQQGMKFVSDNPRYSKFFDQDILNYCFAAQTIKLPLKFNRFVSYARRNSTPQLNKEIYHFAGTRPGFEMNDPFNRLWMHYFIKTPWFSEDSIGRLYAGVQNLHVGLKQSMINISAIMSGKTRAFFTTPDNIDALKKIFSIRDDEEIVRAENQDSLRKLLDAMNASRGKKVFFIMLPNFPFQILIQAGFEPGKDFVNGLEFLSEAQGIPMNSYPLIQAM